MKKIRSEFLTEKEANSAMDKIRPYCGNVKIIYNENYNPMHNYYNNYGYESCIPEENFYNIPDIGGINFGGLNSFGMTAGWNFNSSFLENKYRNTLYHSHSQYNPNRTAIEADVADDNYGYVRDKLYSLGAITAM